jgi:hypothetical protein
MEVINFFNIESTPSEFGLGLDAHATLKWLNDKNGNSK